jgi:hypothetical protein
VWVGCHPKLAFAAAHGWPGARVLVGHGPDGADRALLEAASPEDIAARFDNVIVASGDGVFTQLVALLRLRGLEVTVVARRESLSRRLGRVASRVLVFSDDVGVEAPPAA